MPLVIRELHPAPSSDALNQEWILIENTGPGAQSVSGCTLAVSASGKRPRPVSNLPDQFIKPGEKVRLIVGSPGKASQGTPPTEEEGVRNLPLFLKEPVVQQGQTVLVMLKQLTLCSARV